MGFIPQNAWRHDDLVRVVRAPYGVLGPKPTYLPRVKPIFITTATIMHTDAAGTGALNLSTSNRPPMKPRVPSARILAKAPDNDDNKSHNNNNDNNNKIANNNNHDTLLQSKSN